MLDLLISLLVEGSQCYFSLDHTKIDPQTFPARKVYDEMSEPTLQCFQSTLPKRFVVKEAKIAIRLVLHVCFSNIQPKRLDA